MHVGVIASMKKGLELFIYREVRELAARGASISLYPTKHEPGLYNPPPDWKVYRWRVASVFLCQPLRWAAMPVRYLTVLLAAVRYRALVDFFLAHGIGRQLRTVHEFVIALAQIFHRARNQILTGAVAVTQHMQKLTHFGFDFMQHFDDLFNTLAGNILEGTGFVNLGRFFRHLCLDSRTGDSIADRIT